MRSATSLREARPSAYRSRLLAVAEVLALFCLLRIILVYWLIPLLRLPTRAEFFLIYATWIAAPLLLIKVRGHSFDAYGLRSSDFAEQARLALSLFVPFALQSFWMGFLLPRVLLPAEGGSLRWLREVLIAAGWVAVLLWTSRVLDRRLGDRPQQKTVPKPGGAALPALFLLPLAQVLAPLTLDQRLVGFVYYLLFLGPAEEILYRGYMQSRLNGVFGRPFRLLGANWGWGLVIATLLFGFMHALNGYKPALGQYELDWAWAFGATIAGFVFAYLRERTGSVVAPAILHGLPQAIAALFMSFD